MEPAGFPRKTVFAEKLPRTLLPENSEQKTVRAGAKRQTFHGHRTRDKRATENTLCEAAKPPS